MHSAPGLQRMYGCLYGLTGARLHCGDDGFADSSMANRGARIPGKAQGAKTLAALRRERVNDLCAAGLAEKKRGVVRATLPGLKPIGQVQKFLHSVFPRKMPSRALKSTKRGARTNRKPCSARLSRPRDSAGRFLPPSLPSKIHFSSQQPAQPAPTSRLPIPKRTEEAANAAVGIKNESSEPKAAPRRTLFDIPASVAHRLANNIDDPKAKDEPVKSAPARHHPQGRPSLSTRAIAQLNRGTVRYLNAQYRVRMCFHKLNSAGATDQILVDATHWAMQKHDREPFDNPEGVIMNSVMKRKAGQWG